MWSAHLFVTHIQTEKISCQNGPTVHVCCFMLARASTKTFVNRIHIRQPSPKNSLKNLRQPKNSLAGSLVSRDITVVILHTTAEKTWKGSCIVKGRELTPMYCTVQTYSHVPVCPVLSPSCGSKVDVPENLLYRCEFNPLTPNDPYRGRTALLTSKVAFYIFIQQIWALNILTLWPWSWTFTVQHTIYVKCEYFMNQEG